MGIIAVSDVHLGYFTEGKSQSDKEEFDSFLDSKNFKDIDKFVICGDFLDMWRRDISGVAIENAETINKLKELSEGVQIYYVVGNHDYHLNKLNNLLCPFKLSKEEVLFEGDKKYYFKHGYEFEPLMRCGEQLGLFDLLCYMDHDKKEILSHLYDKSQRGEIFSSGDISLKRYLDNFKVSIKPCMPSDIDKVCD